MNYALGAARVEAREKRRQNWGFHKTIAQFGWECGGNFQREPCPWFNPQTHNCAAAGKGGVSLTEHEGDHSVVVVRLKRGILAGRARRSKRYDKKKTLVLAECCRLNGSGGGRDNKQLDNRTGLLDQGVV